MENLIRIKKAALESRLGATIPRSHPAVNWNTDVMGKCAINSSSISAYKKLHGRNDDDKRIEFAERAFY